MNSHCPLPMRSRGFTLTELIVVIAVIAMLGGILLAAMSGVRRRALYSRTESTMQEFAKACESFQLDHDRYPGALREEILATAPGNGWISGTENALIELMGGSRLRSPFDAVGGYSWTDFESFGGHTFGYPNGWSVKIDVPRIGEGPVINGTPHAPYFTANEQQVAATRGQIARLAMPLQCAQHGESDVLCVPDLLDAWGQPIVYLRRARMTGPLFDDGSGTPPQFYKVSARPYTRSGYLGEFQRPQRGVSGALNRIGSILNASNDEHIENRCFAQIIRHTGFGAPDDAFNGTARGNYVLFSAGPDGVYFSVDDGPGSSGMLIGSQLDFEDFFDMGPAVIDEFDDLRVFGGG